MIKLNPKGQSDPSKTNKENVSSKPTSSGQIVEFQSLDEFDDFVSQASYTSLSTSELLKLYDWFKKSLNAEVDAKLKSHKEFILFLLDSLRGVAYPKEIVGKLSIDEEKGVSYELPDRFLGLAALFQEIEDDRQKNHLEILATLNESLSKINQSLEQLDMEKIYNATSDMMSKLEPYEFTQKKYIYRKIASVINDELFDYKFISPEDGVMIDPKLHNVISGKGQRIDKGLSYVVLNSETQVVVKYGNVKTI